jgi:chromate transporter
VAYTGYRLRGVLGAIVCAVAVTLPTFALILVLSHLYFTWGELPAVDSFFMGIIPAVAAIIVAAAWNMGKKTLAGPAERLIAIAALAALLGRDFVGIPGLYASVGIILAGGLIGYFLFTPRERAGGGAAGGPSAPLSSRLYSTAVLPAAGAVAPLLSVDWTLAAKLLGVFAGMSVLLFGGGFVFIPLMQETVVAEYGWVTDQEFIDGIALGQVTPGPIVITAAFIGYKVAGLLGASAATIGIFGPPAAIMLICTRYLDRIKRSQSIKGALKGVRSAVIGMIAAAGWVVISTAELHWVSLLIFALGLLALLRFKLEVVWIIPAAGIAGLLAFG